MTTVYNKSLSSDFGGFLNPSQLTEEINNSAISATCLNIKNLGDVVSITFGASLSGPELSTLDTLISAHITINGAMHLTNNIAAAITLTDWQTYSTLTTEFLQPGVYRVHWTYTYTADDGQPNIRIIVDDTEVIHLNTATLPVAKGSIEYEKTSWEVLTLTKGHHTIKIQVHGNAGSATSITRARIFIQEA